MGSLFSSNPNPVQKVYIPVYNSLGQETTLSVDPFYGQRFYKPDARLGPQAAFMHAQQLQGYHRNKSAVRAAIQAQNYIDPRMAQAPVIVSVVPQVDYNQPRYEF